MSTDVLERLARNAVHLLPEGGLAEKLRQGRPLRVKLGIDVTSPDIHVGRAIPLQRMRAFQDEGHELTAVELAALHALSPEAIEQFASALDARIQRAEVAAVEEA